MDYFQPATPTSSWGSITKSLRSPLMERDCRCLSVVFYQEKCFRLKFVFILVRVTWPSFSCPVGDRVLGDPALIRCEEVVREDHALSYMGGPEGWRLGAWDRPSRGGSRQPQKRQALGKAGQKPYPGTEFYFKAFLVGRSLCVSRLQVLLILGFNVTNLYSNVFLLQTDEVHAKDNTRPGANTPGK